MTPEEQRIAIAKACGWRRALTHRGIFFYCEGQEEYFPNVPDYLNDLNAMHEAEKVLNEKQQVWYLQRLTQVRYRAGVRGMIGCMIDKIAFATAAQRAEAFLRTLNLWRDE